MDQVNDDIKRISSLISEIMPILQEIGFKRTAIVFRADKIEKATPEQRTKSIEWLVEFRDGFVAVYLKAKNLVPALVWEMYALDNRRGTHEQKELLVSRMVLRARWRNRPDILRRISVPKAGKKNRKARK